MLPTIKTRQDKTDRARRNRGKDKARPDRAETGQDKAKRDF